MSADVDVDVNVMSVCLWVYVCALLRLFNLIGVNTTNMEEQKTAVILYLFDIVKDVPEVTSPKSVEAINSPPPGSGLPSGSDTVVNSVPTSVGHAAQQLIVENSAEADLRQKETSTSADIGAALVENSADHPEASTEGASELTGKVVEFPKTSGTLVEETAAIVTSQTASDEKNEETLSQPSLTDNL